MIPLNQVRTLHSIVDPFVLRAGGELIERLITDNGALPKNADYLFREQNVIVELKALEANTFGESYRRKFSEMSEKWQRQDVIRVYGRASVNLDQLPEVCQREWLALLGESLQQVVKHANRQIRSSKTLLRIPDAKGLLLLASDGNTDMTPGWVWFLLNRIFQMRKEGGERAYSHIDAFAYFNPRMPAIKPGLNTPVIIWWALPRDPGDEKTRVWLGEMERTWFEYLAWAQGIEIRPISGASTHDVGFVPAVHRRQKN